MRCRVLTLVIAILPIVLGLQLYDLVNENSQRLLDTFERLSDDVSNQYANDNIAHDPSPSFNYEKPEYSLRDLNRKYRNLLFDGDMVLEEDKIRRFFAASREKRQAYLDETYPESIWQSGVPFVLDDSLSPQAKASIMRAIHFWYKETCINFTPRRDEEQYLIFIGNDEGCWSTVGRDGAQKRQVVSIGKGCEHFGVTSHELQHALGVYHEQSRYDRDNHVRLNKKVVPRSMLYNFAKVPIGISFNYDLPYDVGSVMHYQPSEFSEVPSIPALSAVNPHLQQTMGQLKEPSFLDVAIVNRHYKCEQKCLHRLVCLRGGYVNPRSCHTCKCPAGFSGRICQSIEPSFSKSCGGEIQVESTVKRFEITIHQTDHIYEKKCIYHFKAPTGKRILINLLKVNGRCEEGCWQDAVEFKMSSDFRPTGYRFCCPETSRKILISETNLTPLLIYSSKQKVEVAFEYSLVDRNVHFDPDSVNTIDERVFTNTIYHGNTKEGIVGAISD